MYPAESRPIPAKIRDGIAASIRALGPGQSFLIPQSDVKPTTRKVAHREAVRLSVPVSIRKVEDGLRVFRLDSWPKRGNSGSLEAAGDVLREERGPNHSPIRPDYYPPLKGEPNTRTKEQKQKYLAEYFDGKVEAEPRDAIKEIDAQVNIESDPEWIDAGEAFDETTGDMVPVEKHIKTGRFRKK